MTNRQIKLQARKKELERMTQVRAALADEMTRFNDAIRDGAIVMLETFAGTYRVKSVTSDFWYHTTGNGGFGQSWCGCNDGTWHKLMTQANCPRNPLFTR